MSKPKSVDTRARGKLDEPTLARILANVATGMPRAHACAKEGVSRQALYQLAERDPSVHERLEAAAELGAEWYREQVMHAEDDWKRWAWLAERLHPTLFAPPRQRVEQTGADGGAIKSEVKVIDTVDRLSDDEVLRQARAILAAEETNK